MTEINLADYNWPDPAIWQGPTAGDILRGVYDQRLWGSGGSEKLIKSYVIPSNNILMVKSIRLENLSLFLSGLSATNNNLYLKIYRNDTEVFKFYGQTLFAPFDCYLYIAPGTIEYKILHTLGSNALIKVEACAWEKVSNRSL